MQGDEEWGSAPVCCSFLLFTLLCSSLGPLHESFSINLLQHGLSMGYSSFRTCLLGAALWMSAPPWSLQGLQGNTCSTRTSPGSQGNLCLGLCLAWGSPSLSSQRSPLQLPSSPAPLGTCTHYTDKHFSVSK